MTDGRGFPELRVPAVGRQPALVLRPWRAADIPALAAEMSREYPVGGMWPGPGERPVRKALPGGTQRPAGPAGEGAAARWLASQDRGWRDGDRLSFAVLEADDAGGCRLAGNVGLKNREQAGQVGERETAEIGYWTAVAARGRGIAPAAVRAVTAWVFDTFAGTSLRQIILVHDVGNPASCRVAHKAGYSCRELSPANPPHWPADGHIHMRLGGWPGPTADAQQRTTLPARPGDQPIRRQPRDPPPVTVTPSHSRAEERGAIAPNRRGSVSAAYTADPAQTGQFCVPRATWRPPCPSGRPAFPQDGRHTAARP